MTLTHDPAPGKPAGTCEATQAAAEPVEPLWMPEAYLLELAAQRAEIERILALYPDHPPLSWPPWPPTIDLPLTTPPSGPVDERKKLKAENQSLRRMVSRLRTQHREDMDFLAGEVLALKAQMAGRRVA